MDKSVFIKPYSSLFFAIAIFISIHSNLCGNGSCFLDNANFNSQALQYNNITVSKNGFFFALQALQLTVDSFQKMIFLRYCLTVLQFWKTFFFKMPQRKVNVITERWIFGDDNDLPRDIRDMKSGVRGILCSVIVATLEV